MSNDRLGEFGDRVQAERYRQDPMVGVFDYNYADPAEVMVPKRVWRRLHLLGTGYELRYLSLLDGGSEPVFLNSTQALSLAHELRFVETLVNDALLLAAVRAIADLATAAPRFGQNPAIRIEGQ